MLPEAGLPQSVYYTQSLMRLQCIEQEKTKRIREIYGEQNGADNITLLLLNVYWNEYKYIWKVYVTNLIYYSRSNVSMRMSIVYVISWLIGLSINWIWNITITTV